MAAHCPSCGSDVDLTPRAIEVEAGTCPGCSRAFLLLPPNADLTTTTVVAAPSSEVSSGADADEEELSANCAECGGTLVLSVDDESVLAATCEDCDTAFRLVRADAPEGPTPTEAAAPVAERSPRRPRTFEDADDRPRRSGGDWNSAPQSRARPCRKCGGPIVFSDSPEGGMVGTCQSCGNRFNLRPRTEGSGERSYSSGPRRDSRQPWKRGGSSGGFSRGPPRRPGGYSRGRSDSNDDDRRDRRRRRDD
ncbi:MAG TPA: hypothetical protein VN864_08340 [Thermoplasmata archaeon]|nr:hypothetical protein [Thermoplasmata archaeon]